MTRNCKEVLDRFLLKKAPGLNTDKNIQEPPQIEARSPRNPIEGMCYDLSGNLVECLEKAFKLHIKQGDRKILVIALNDFYKSCKNGKLCIQKSSSKKLPIFNLYTGLQTIKSSVQDHMLGEVLFYGFGQPDSSGHSSFESMFEKRDWINANDQCILAWMKQESLESSVLVAHADVCRGFEWPTVITISM